MLYDLPDYKSFKPIKLPEGKRLPEGIKVEEGSNGWKFTYGPNEKPDYRPKQGYTFAESNIPVTAVRPGPNSDVNGDGVLDSLTVTTQLGSEPKENMMLIANPSAYPDYYQYRLNLDSQETTSRKDASPQIRYKDTIPLVLKDSPDYEPLGGLHDQHLTLQDVAQPGLTQIGYDRNDNNERVLSLRVNNGKGGYDLQDYPADSVKVDVFGDSNSNGVVDSIRLTPTQPGSGLRFPVTYHVDSTLGQPTTGILGRDHSLKE